METNICYNTNAVQERGAVDGNYAYSYPYIISTSLLDTARHSEEQGHQQTIAGTISSSEIEAESVIKQRRCDNEEDIYSYII